MVRNISKFKTLHWVTKHLNNQYHQISIASSGTRTTSNMETWSPSKTFTSKNVDITTIGFRLLLMLKQVNSLPITTKDPFYRKIQYINVRLLLQIFGQPSSEIETMQDSATLKGQHLLQSIITRIIPPRGGKGGLF